MITSPSLYDNKIPPSLNSAKNRQHAHTHAHTRTHTHNSNHEQYTYTKNYKNSIVVMNIFILTFIYLI